MDFKSRLASIFTLSRVLLGGMVLLLFLPFTCTTRDEHGRTELTVWVSLDSPEESAIFHEQMQRFEQLHPDIKVRLEIVGSSRRTQKYLAAMQAGNCADLIILHWLQVPVFAAKDMLVPLDELIRRDAYDADDFFASSLHAYSYEGQQVALPEKGSTQLLFYNKTLFDAAGIAYPDDDWTVDDFIAAAKAMTKTDEFGRITQIGALPYDVASWVWTLGGRFATDDLNELYFTEPGTIAGVQFLWNLRNDWQVTTRNMNARGRDPGEVDVFEKGNVAMAIGGPWNFAKYEAIDSFEWDVALFPKGPGGRKTRYAAMGYAIWSGSPHPDETWRLMRYLLSAECMSQRRGKGYADVPARKSVAYGEFAKQDAPFDISVLLRSMDPEHSEVMVLPKNERWGLIERMFFEEIDLAMIGHITPEQAMHNTQKRAERMLAADRYEPGMIDYAGLAAIPVVLLGCFSWFHRMKKGA